MASFRPCCGMWMARSPRPSATATAWPSTRPSKPADCRGAGTRRATASCCAITGGRERLLHDMKTRRDAPVLADERSALVARLHAAEERALRRNRARRPRSHCAPASSTSCSNVGSAGVRMGIATTTSRTNVDALLRIHLGPHWAEWFAVQVCGEDVQRKKPDPEVYLQALQALGVGPLACVAIEDSPGGVCGRARGADPGGGARAAPISGRPRSRAPSRSGRAWTTGATGARHWACVRRPATHDGQGVGLDDIEALVRPDGHGLAVRLATPIVRCWNAAACK